VSSEPGAGQPDQRAQGGNEEQPQDAEQTDGDGLHADFPLPAAVPISSARRRPWPSQPEGRCRSRAPSCQHEFALGIIFERVRCEFEVVNDAAIEHVDEPPTIDRVPCKAIRCPSDDPLSITALDSA
jgi:hypothetical protein